MNISVWFFISSALFLGWAAGANNAANLFGTAVISKMVKFRTAAIIAGIFVVLGSVISGAGTTETLTDLGSVNALAGSFAVAVAVGISIILMIRAKVLVSSSQVILGGIIGWNLFTGSPTDNNALYKILSSWVASPVIAAIFGFILFKIVKNTVLKWKIHLLELDSYTRIGLIIAGALAAYSFGANNIANVMGMFVDSAHLQDLNVGSVFTLNGEQQLFFFGGAAISVGIFTYGTNVMDTVGEDFTKISPITGLVAISAEIIVLFLFTSQRLEQFLLENNLPTIPLVPLSITQAFIGAIIGTGLAKDPHSINFKVLGRMVVGWAVAPVTAAIITVISLFFIQNVFEQTVVIPEPYEITNSVIIKLESEGINGDKIKDLSDKRFFNKREFRNEILQRNNYTNEQIYSIFAYSLIDSFVVDSNLINSRLHSPEYSKMEIDFLKSLHSKSYSHKIDFEKDVFQANNLWQNTGDKLTDKKNEDKKLIIEQLFRIKKTNKSHN